MILKSINIILLIISISLFSCSKELYKGKYQLKKSISMYTQYITIKCNNSAVINFTGGFIDDYSYGKWSINSDTLMIEFDTINYPNSRYRKTQYFKTTRKRLKPIIGPNSILLTDSINTIEFDRFMSTNYYNRKPFKESHSKLIEKFDCKKSN